MSGEADFKIAKYTEGCNSLRHYSSCIMQIRIIAAVEGLVILGLVVYTGQYFYLGLFGLIFTSILWVLDKNYYDSFMFILKKVVKIEKSGVWTTLDNKRKKTNRYIKYLYHHGTFILFFITFFIIIFFGICHYLQEIVAGFE